MRSNFIFFGCLAFMWSGSFINIKAVVDVMPPIFCAMMRVFVSFLALTLIFAATRRSFLTISKHTWKIWIAGILSQALPFGLLFYGEKFVAPAMASIINSTVSLWALLLGACIFKDFTSWTPSKILGLLLGFIGIVIIFLPSIGRGESSLIGILSIIGMSVAYAIGGLLNQHVIFAKIKASFENNLFQQHFASVLVLLIASLSLETWPPLKIVLTPNLGLAFLYLGVVATALAWIIYFHLIREWGAVRTASVMYIVPVLAILWDLLFLEIIPPPTELIGGAAILFGVILVQWTRKVKLPISEPQKITLARSNAES